MKSGTAVFLFLLTEVLRRTSVAAWCGAGRAEVLSSNVACEVAKTDERRPCTALSRGVSEPAGPKAPGGGARRHRRRETLKNVSNDLLSPYYYVSPP